MRRLIFVQAQGASGCQKAKVGRFVASCQIRSASDTSRHFLWQFSLIRPPDNPAGKRPDTPDFNPNRSIIGHRAEV